MNNAETKKNPLNAEKEKSTKELISDLENEIDNSLLLIDAYREEFLRNRLDEMNGIFVELVTSLQLFMIGILELKQSKELSAGAVAEDFFSVLACSDDELLGVLREILRAKENKDLVHLNDLLEFGLSENLIRWRDGFIPTVKGLLF